MKYTFRNAYNQLRNMQQRGLISWDDMQTMLAIMDGEALDICLSEIGL